MGRGVLRFFAVLMLVGAIVAAPAVAAATITPDGACTGTGEFTPGPDVDAASATRIEIPLKASVVYNGAVVLPAPPPPEGRPVSGNIQIELPPPIGSITIGDWDTTGFETSRSGTYTYDLPSVLAGFDVTVTGAHFENSVLHCSGVVTLRFEGSNPLGIASLLFTGVSILGVGLSMRVKGVSSGAGGSVVEVQRPGGRTGEGS